MPAQTFSPLPASQKLCLHTVMAEQQDLRSAPSMRSSFSDETPVERLWRLLTFLQGGWYNVLLVLCACNSRELATHTLAGAVQHPCFTCLLSSLCMEAHRKGRKSPYKICKWDSQWAFLSENNLHTEPLQQFCITNRHYKNPVALCHFFFFSYHVVDRINKEMWWQK